MVTAPQMSGWSDHRYTFLSERARLGPRELRPFILRSGSSLSPVRRHPISDSVLPRSRSPKMVT